MDDIGLPLTSRWELDDDDGGTRLTARAWVDVPERAGPEAVTVQEQMMAELQRYVGRVKALLEGPPLGGLWASSAAD